MSVTSNVVKPTIRASHMHICHSAAGREATGDVFLLKKNGGLALAFSPCFRFGDTVSIERYIVYKVHLNFEPQRKG
jgi:hypothetical protein